MPNWSGSSEIENALEDGVRPSVNGGVKVSHLAEQQCTTRVVYSRDHLGCQYSVLASSFRLPGQAFTALLKAIALPVGLNNMDLVRKPVQHGTGQPF